MYRVALNQSCSNGGTETRIVPMHPSSQRVHRLRGPRFPPCFYNLYTKINVFEIPTTIELYKMTFLCFVLLLTRNSFTLYLFICTKYVALCAQHSSRPLAEQPLRELLSPSLFYSFLFFDTIFEIHSQLSSANLIIALAFTELQDHLRSPRELRHARVTIGCKASSSEYCSSSLFLFSFFFGFF